jgi:DNA mismatch repair protein MutL
MGFRGEALPSIAAVSEVILTTRSLGEISGTTVKVKNGEIGEVSDAGCAYGTTVEVRNIFFNTPARLKFMRSISTETGHISDTITRLALAYPSIRFRLYNNNAGMVETSLRADLRRRIADIFGRDFLEGVIPLEAGDNVLRVHGFIAKPESTHSTTKWLFVYVNNRWIRDRGINHAIANGYRNCLANGKYPFVALFINIAPQHVDVNVHPTKCEVRFGNPKGVYELVKNAIEAALAPSYVQPYKSTSFPFKKGWHGGVELPDRVRNGTILYDVAASTRKESRFEVCSKPSDKVEFAESTPDAKSLFFGELEVIGRLWLEYLLCQRESEFYIIDQHAAAERIAFEKLKKDYYYDRRIPSQMLLLPQQVEFSLQERDVMESSMQTLINLGFDIEQFSGNTFIIRAVPDMLSGKDCRSLIKDMIDEVASLETSFKIEDKLDDMFMRIACHSVIRGKRSLSHEEAKALLKGLSHVDFSGNCPHGRPIIKAISKLEIEKMFKRR